ncbi:glutathionylspermidine synthase family protein [Paenibacillus arenosi]|uniref:Glutathionylspermidine synthase family protein n=1 Tax=Paenibacillus arenosi TaxID=2774142 RepID=A0ABR9AUP5_9BACL|nr:glutathionylspermidine synthase family protein [Paenibacillus arenosi]MBD8497804.1 glutathionylspermidine synthase family protein [Paenibacillus arenosi]
MERKEAKRVRPTMSLPLTASEAFHAERLQHVPYVRMHQQEYCMTHVMLYTEDEIAELRTASEQLHQIFMKALRLVQEELPDEILAQQIGIPAKLLGSSRISFAFSGIARQDWIKGPEGWKCIENNADTPTGIPETAYLAEQLLADSRAADHSLEIHLHNPSADLEHRLQQALGEMLVQYRELGYGTRVVCSSFANHEEDKANTAYVMRLMQQLGWEVEYCPLEELRVEPARGLIANDRPVDIWYRLYPLEYLMDDLAPDGYPVGEAVLALAEEGRLAIMNPPQSIILQSKALLAFVWACFEHHETLSEARGERLYTEEELVVIQRYLLPTYLNATPFRERQQPYVQKSIWGREGKGTSIYGEDGKQFHTEDTIRKVDLSECTVEEQEEVMRYYNDQLKIYQQYVPMEAARLETEEGYVDGFVLTGVYTPNGRFGGVLPRLGGRITGDLARFCPAAVWKLANR